MNAATSSLHLVTGVWQESLSGPVLFNSFIDNK